MEYEKSQSKNYDIPVQSERPEPMFQANLNRLDQEIQHYEKMTYQVSDKLNMISGHNYNGDMEKSPDVLVKNASDKWVDLLSKISKVNDRMRTICEHLDTIV